MRRSKPHANSRPICCARDCEQRLSRNGENWRYCKPAIGKNGKIKPDWGDRGSAPNRRCIGGKSDSSDSEQYITASTILPFLLKEPDLLSHEEPSPGVVPKSM